MDCFVHDELPSLNDYKDYTNKGIFMQVLYHLLYKKRYFPF